jgi:hypothetical protein
MTRTEFHSRIDEQLNALGYKDKIEVPWGPLMIQVNYEGCKEILIVKERETKKEFARK